MTLDVKQKKVLEWQIMQQNLQMIKQREQEVAMRVEELAQAKLALEELGRTKPGKALIPIGGGNYLDGSVADTGSVIVGVGAGIAVRESREEAIKSAEKKSDELIRALAGVHKEEQRVIREMDAIRNELQKLEKR